MTVTVLRITGQVYYRVPSYRNLSDVFLMVRLAVGVLERKITEEQCLFQHILLRVCNMNVIYHVDIDVDHLLSL